MPEKITTDPNLAQMPDFASEIYDGLCTAIIAAPNTTNEQAIASLQASETAENDCQRILWQQQLDTNRADEEARRAAEKANELQQLERQREKEEQAWLLKKQEKKEKQKKREKKKLKLNPIICNKTAPMQSIATLSAYAIQQLKLLKYVELHYFTVKGCEEAQ